MARRARAHRRRANPHRRRRRNPVAVVRRRRRRTAVAHYRANPVRRRRRRHNPAMRVHRRRRYRRNPSGATVMTLLTELGAFWGGLIASTAIAQMIPAKDAVGAQTVLGVPPVGALKQAGSALGLAWLVKRYAPARLRDAWGAVALGGLFPIVNLIMTTQLPSSVAQYVYAPLQAYPRLAAYPAGARRTLAAGGASGQTGTGAGQRTVSRQQVPSSGMM
jgi:hypothetical protein